MPQFRNLAGDAERAFGGIKLPPLVGDEINVRRAGDAMGAGQTRGGGIALEFKIGLYVLCRENVCQRFAPDYAAFAVGIFQNVCAVAFAPKFVREFFHPRIALWKIGKAGRMLRARADHDCAGAHQFTDALQHLRRHVCIAGRQNQHGVAGTARQRDAAILHRRLIHQHVGIDGVVVVTGGQRGIAGAHFHRRTFAGKIRGIGHGAALLQEKLAARDVINPGFSLLPPCLRALEVKAPLAHRHARPAVCPRLHRVTVEDVAVQALAVHQIAERLERIWIVLPAPMTGTCGERLRADDGFAVNVRDGRGELDGGMPLAAAPEFAHHHVSRRAALQRFKRPGVRLDRAHQTVLTAQLGEMAVVIFSEQIRDGPSHVPEKPFGDFGVVHDAAGDCRQEFKGIVAAPFLELGAKIFRPVLAPDFVAVNQRTVERLPGERADVVENFLHEARPMRVERGLAELVAFQALAFPGRGMIVRASRRVAETQNDPIARRDVPPEPAVRRELRRQIHDAVARNCPGCGGSPGGRRLDERAIRRSFHE